MFQGLYFLLIYLVNLNDISSFKVPGKLVDFKYHDYENLQKVVSLLERTKCASIGRVYSIGKSVEGRDLIVMEVSSKNTTPTDFKPAFYFGGNIHGNEAASKEVLLHLVEDFCDNFNENDPFARRLLNFIDIHFLFSINPDGFEKAPRKCRGKKGRFNANGVDLNRNFQYLDYCPPDAVQPETQAIMQWSKEHYFVFSTVLHGGDMVVVYPYDGDHTNVTRELPSPDNAFLVSASRNFVRNANNYILGGCHNLFSDGIINGNAWYPVVNSIQDFTMYMTPGLQITLELGCCKYPEPEELPSIYRNFKDALMSLPLYALQGVKGRIIDDRGHPFSEALIEFIGGGKTVKTNKNGYFYKNLTPGVYKAVISTSPENTHKKEVEIEVLNKFEPTEITIIF